MTALPIHTTFKDSSMQQTSVKIQTFIIFIFISIWSSSDFIWVVKYIDYSCVILSLGLVMIKVDKISCFLFLCFLSHCEHELSQE